jgi:hypothetical protein
VVLPLRYNDSNALVDSTGRRIYPESGNPQLNETRHPVAKYVGNFAKRLFCGSKCAEASAPETAGEAKKAPKQLSDARIARNAVSQALAARALVKFLGKIGVVIDEGVDGIINSFMPDGLGVDDEEDARKVAQWLAERRALRAKEQALAEQGYRTAEALYLTAVARRDKLHERYLAAKADLDGADPSDVAIELLTRTFLDDKNEYEAAEADAAARNFKAQAAWDWWQALRSDEHD